MWPSPQITAQASRIAARQSLLSIQMIQTAVLTMTTAHIRIIRKSESGGIGALASPKQAGAQNGLSATDAWGIALAGDANDPMST
jgi:hypothetical protein